MELGDFFSVRQNNAIRWFLGDVIIFFFFNCIHKSTDFPYDPDYMMLLVNAAVSLNNEQTSSMVWRCTHSHITHVLYGTVFHTMEHGILQKKKNTNTKIKRDL